MSLMNIKTIIYIYINKIRGTQKAKGETHTHSARERDMIGECVYFNKLGTRNNKKLHFDQVSFVELGGRT